MMRGVSNWAVAVRKPTAEQLAAGERLARARRALGEIEVTTFPLDSAARRHRLLRLPIVRGRGRARRLAGDRLPRARGLGQRAAAARGGRGGAAGDPEGPCGRARSCVALALAIVLFFLVPVGLTSLIKDQLGSSVLFWLVEGLVRTRIFLGYMLAALARARPAARVRVPRRRAQDDLLLRGRPAADARQAPSASRACTRAAARASCCVVMIVAIFVFAPIGLPAWYWLLATRILGVPLIAGHLLRADQVRRAQPHPPLGARGDVAGAEAAAADHARARPRPARRRDRLARGRPRASRSPGELSAADLVGVEVVA